MCFGAIKFLTLYINISISCRRLLTKLGSFALLNSSSYAAVLLLYTARSARSCTLSSFLVSDALQKCHTVWQYVRFGRIAALYSWSLASVGIIFLRRTKTPTFLLACLHISLTCLLNLSLSSNVTPSNLRSGVDLMVYPSMFTFMDWTLLFPLFINIALYLSYFPFRKLSPYHLDIVCPSSLSDCSTYSTEFPAT